MRSRYTKPSTESTITLKRSPVYDIVEDDDTVEARRKMAKMTVDE